MFRLDNRRPKFMAFIPNRSLEVIANRTGRPFRSCALTAMVTGESLMALANFANPGGLLNIGNTLWQQSPNSGSPLVGTASTGQFGSLAAGELEGSNVNLANEFVNMIIAQQGYQANSKVITVSQQLDTTLVNMVQ